MLYSGHMSYECALIREKINKKSVLYLKQQNRKHISTLEYDVPQSITDGPTEKVIYRGDVSYSAKLTRQKAIQYQKRKASFPNINLLSSRALSKL